MVSFTQAGGSTPNTLFTGLNDYANYLVYCWTAPGGPYNLQDPEKAFQENLDYWVWTDQDRTVVTSGTPSASSDIHLVTWRNLVSLPVVNSGTTPENKFAPLSYYTDYFIYYFTAPGGPYVLQDPDTGFDNVLGYWIWINQNKTVTVP